MAVSVVLGATAFIPASPALAEDAPVVRSTDVVSFDGTPIHVNFMRAENLTPGKKVPTVLFGPGYSHPGWSDPDRATDESTGEPGTGDLRKAGYNVVTWDPRGFGGSGGESKFNDVAYEGRDVQAIIDYVATQPEVMLDKAGDPRLGMAGGSYGGNIQLVAAALDSRIDVISPAFTWNNMHDVIYQDGALKLSLATVLCAFVTVNGTTGVSVTQDEYDGVGSDIQGASIEMQRICTEGIATGKLSPDLEDWLSTRGAIEVMSRVKVPTLFQYGTTDAAIPLNQGVRNYNAIKANGVPVKMVWFCGGHNPCNTTAGPARVKTTLLNWFARHLDKHPAISTGPGFEWVDQNGIYRGASAYPLKKVGTLAALGGGLLPITTINTLTAGVTEAAPSAGGLHLPLPTATGTMTGEPVLTMTYTGNALLLSPKETHVYAQVIDKDRGTVIGKLATPIPVLLDGQPHVITRPLETLGYTLTPETHLEVQIIAGSGGYAPQSAAGTLAVGQAKVDFPLTVSGTTIENR
ncbi:alpha/beta hydrolase family protein [Pseudarthrobacter scleromae]|uniref:alpha/beta hydrolase family protein n=1 Tax=Pseudarthrobacter scleromae TaxID=158897 RepID=UPI003D00F9D0